MVELDYNPKSILVTGGAGFIASHVTIKLVQQYPGCKVRVLQLRLAASTRSHNLDPCNEEGSKSDICVSYIICYLCSCRLLECHD